MSLLNNAPWGADWGIYKRSLGWWVFDADGQHRPTVPELAAFHNPRHRFHILRNIPEYPVSQTAEAEFARLKREHTINRRLMLAWKQLFKKET